MDRRVLIFAAALLTGCANSPTTAARGEMPARFDAGGGLFSSGHYTEPSSPGGDGVLATSGVRGSVMDDSANTTGEGRGGGSFGSGN